MGHAFRGKQYYTIVDKLGLILYPFLHNSIDFFTPGDQKKNETRPGAGACHEGAGFHA